MEWLGSVGQVFGVEFFHKLARTAFLLVLGYLLGKAVSMLAVSAARRYTARQGTMIARRAGFWVIMGLAIISALNQLGFEVGVLLGAAGIVTVAIGFASQTSASNLISGLFLIGERPFVVGDAIKVGETSGEVLSIDLLSVKLRTFDNLFVRVPNEALIKSEIVNYTRFPIRRIDISLGVDGREDVARIRRLLFEIAEQNRLCLVEPAPIFIFSGFGESSLELLFCVWARSEKFLEVKNGLQEEIRRRFGQEGIDMPFPRRRVELAFPPDGLRVDVAGRQHGRGDETIAGR